MRSCLPFNLIPPLTNACSPTGWHKESGGPAGGQDSHLTIFLKVLLKNRDWITTPKLHIYPTEAAYDGIDLHWKLEG